MDWLVAGLVLALMAGMAVGVGRTGYRLWRAGVTAERPLLIHRMLDREGFSLEGCTDSTILAQAAAAARGCLLCRERQTCAAWLAGDDRISRRLFCPNAQLIDRVAAKQRAVRSL